MTSLAMSRAGEYLEGPVSRDGAVARGLVDRGGLLELVGRAVAKRGAGVAAPPGSGKTSLLRAWADRSVGRGRVAFVSVGRGEQDAERFWCAVMDAIRGPAGSVDPESRPAAAVFEGDEVVDAVASAFAEQVEPVVLIIDDLHELRSADALAQLERVLMGVPAGGRV